jgi:hypothetical protein
MIETKTKTIDGLTFMSTQLPPLKAYPLAARVAAIVMPAFAKLMGSGLDFGDADKFLSQDASKLAPILGPLLEALGKAENEDLPQKLLVGTTVQMPDDSGQMSVLSLASPEGINRAFQGKGLLIYKAMWFAVEVNFADFFAGASKSTPTKASGADAKAKASA